MVTNPIPMSTFHGPAMQATGERPDGQRSAFIPQPYPMAQDPAPAVLPELHSYQYTVPNNAMGNIPGHSIPPFPSGPGEPPRPFAQEDPRQSNERLKKSGEARDKAQMKEKSGHKHHHQVDTSSIPCEVKHDKIVSTDPILSRDAKALEGFLRLYGTTRPVFFAHIIGTHEERHTRSVSDGRGGSRTETYYVTVIDFAFCIDLSDVFVNDEGPVLYTLRDDVPAYRGGMAMATETGGARPIEQRTPVEKDVQSAQKRAREVGRQVGRPPWLAMAENQVYEDEALIGGTPLASSRSFQEWLEDYVHSRRVVKEFKFSKEVYAWDLEALKVSLEQLVRSTGYSATLRIGFKATPESVHIYSPNIVSKIFSSYFLIFITTVTLIFPFLWMWRRWWPEAGGKWQVCGAAFRLKRWELVPRTGPGETEQGAMERLGGPAGVGGHRLRAGREGVYVLKGVHEADWFRSWEQTIRNAVFTRVKTNWLMRGMVGADFASGLDRL
ncbi:hypothetical protein M408DRAFT_313576 [Serendipita vermifera MAFF 305830]|uniref:Uncharacterized protein n=1 Tax=Serendipita vermifera MAFF 305830 TaxID=933852 RepID=A0A0C3B4T5_SERVB|nr:hypothetical protein M408DRAFT_313576 [Serendipita vermifera MAFF 305830]